VHKFGRVTPALEHLALQHLPRQRREAARGGMSACALGNRRLHGFLLLVLGLLRRALLQVGRGGRGGQSFSTLTAANAPEKRRRRVVLLLMLGLLRRAPLQVRRGGARGQQSRSTPRNAPAKRRRRVVLLLVLGLHRRALRGRGGRTVDGGGGDQSRSTRCDGAPEE